MVDFQSRTPRTRDDEDDEDEDETGEVEETAETARAAGEEESPTVETPEMSRLTEDDPLSYAVITVTEGRTTAEDAQGDAVIELLENAGETVATRDLIPPSFDGVQSRLVTLAKRDDVDALITIGGTGVEPSDVTVDAVDPLFDKQLPGFGELFRLLAHDTRGAEIIGTRTTAGIIGGTPVFILPGTIDGATLATEELILPEAWSLANDARQVESE